LTKFLTQTKIQSAFVFLQQFLVDTKTFSDSKSITNCCGNSL
jgi:hypothetical protein